MREALSEEKKQEDEIDRVNKRLSQDRSRTRRAEPGDVPEVLVHAPADPEPEAPDGEPEPLQPHADPRPARAAPRECSRRPPRCRRPPPVVEQLVDEELRLPVPRLFGVHLVHLRVGRGRRPQQQHPSCLRPCWKRKEEEMDLCCCDRSPRSQLDACWKLALQGRVHMSWVI